jgi:ATPase subunit of ABC transporter with duplicated ATPase domains
MGFAPSDASLPVDSFSGGWKMRIGLGKILLQEPQARNHHVPPPRINRRV